MYTKKRLIFLIISWLLVALWMTFIFMMSHDNGEQSIGRSDGLLKTLILTFNPNIGDIELDMLMTKLSGVIRVLAHMFMYFTLYILVANSLYLHNLPLKKVYIIAFIVTVLYAISDELHQYFIPMRSASVIDVITDTAGAIIGMVYHNIVIHIMNKIRKNRRLVLKQSGKND